MGSVNNTFGCPGVEEHTQFFKSVDDARKFRRQVLQCFERAALPETTPEVPHLRFRSHVEELQAGSSPAAEAWAAAGGLQGPVQALAGAVLSAGLGPV